MKNSWKIGLFIMAITLFLPVLSRAQQDYIDIRNPSLRKIPLAIPAFNINPDAMQDLGVQAAGLLAQDLDFTGYFKLLDRGAFLINPQNPPTDVATINFSNWTGIGAELLITGSGVMQGDLVDLELRLFDPYKGELLLGKRYKAWQKDLQQVLRRFAGEVIYYLTGNWGIFASRIAFISNGTGNKEIYLCDFDGSNIERFTRSNSITLTPAWSSDGKWLAYTSFAKGKADLYIRNLNQNIGAIVEREGLNTTPAWVPGQFQLAATQSFSGDQQIYLLTGQGEMVKQITDKWGIDTSPTWSPDGRRMAFVSDRAGNPQIYIKDIGSGRVERLTFEGRYNTQPCWSPRGDKIAYSTVERGEINIMVIDVNTKEAARLTYSSGKNESPSWSPDGSLIVFSSNREGPYRLYVMTSYGTDQRRLLSMPGEQTSPAWSPRLTNEN